MEKREGKRQFAALRAAVSQALRKADPIGLIQGGAPPDEYDPEVGTILPRLGTARSSEDVRAIVHEEFVRWFGAEIAGDIEDYQTAAEKIWATLSTEKAV
ncbi:MAG TPA: hypothetical protein VNL14_22125 [Candidatus Acidoferrales bacterium]|nr:hypothetical protein [Candidatus Acidoferrales bacterium]